MPSGTKYGYFKFDYIKSRPGLDSNWEKPKKAEK